MLWFGDPAEDVGVRDAVHGFDEICRTVVCLVFKNVVQHVSVMADDHLLRGSFMAEPQT